MTTSHPRTVASRHRASRLGDHVKGAAVALTAASLLFTLSSANADPALHDTNVDHWPGFYHDDNARLPSGDGTATDSAAVGTGPTWNAFNWGPGPLAAVPAAYGIDTIVGGRTEQKIFLSSQANEDVGAAESITNMSISHDSGTSFLTTERHAPTSAHNMVQLEDGSLMAIQFIPKWTDASRKTVDLQIKRSTNDGRTWRSTTGTFTPPEGKEFGPFSNGLRVHRAPRVLPDGTLVAPGYTAYKGEQQTAIFMQSTDNGETWTQRSQIASDEIGINEVGWAFASNGDLVAAVRTTDSPARLRISRSSDQGKTWSEPVPLLGPDRTQIVGIYPDLVLQPNGALLLATGRPDNQLLISNDGTGKNWDHQEVIFANPPSKTGNGRFDGSSGNAALVNIGASRTLFIGDKCHVWGCQGYNEQFGIFVSPVQAVTPGVGKLDIATALHTGKAKLRGDVSRRNRHFPETRPEGAFDGSTRSHAAVELYHPSRPATMTLELDRTYSLSKIGLMLGSGLPHNAEVSLSTDGKAFTEPVASAKDTRDFAMRYTSFAPQQARYVKVTVPADTVTPITELELFDAELQTFENDPLYDVPRGFSDAINATTTDQRLGAQYHENPLDAGDHSSASLRLFDKDTTKQATATKLVEQRSTQRVSFSFSQADFRGPFGFDVMGEAAGEQVAAWQFRLVPGKDTKAPPTLTTFDGSQWQPVGTLSSAVPQNSWLPIEVATAGEEATITLGSQEFTTSVRAQQSESYVGVRFSTGDADTYGATFHIDDLSITAS